MCHRGFLDGLIEGQGDLWRRGVDAGAVGGITPGQGGVRGGRARSEKQRGHHGGEHRDGAQEGSGQQPQ
ncbi:hypothetical protein ACQP2U_07540 [Nocardia sp. CA-084685]|uniref:hypothetical protein n=1 Tax=Nocardia sp. CA-084685 TaxID=3239970 RepID=UPI003D988C34